MPRLCWKPPAWSRPAAPKKSRSRVSAPWRGRSTMASPDPFAEAVALHRAGKLAEAMELYKQVLRANPGHAGALHMLGVLVHKIGDPAMAVKLIVEAVRLNPA